MLTLLGAGIAFQVKKKWVSLTLGEGVWTSSIENQTIAKVDIIEGRG
ncbi:MAG: hypothetical protein KBT36_03595 [Kurthia sp.]|nr:hypothetical protein [Candidatus Kurthia equi]